MKIALFQPQVDVDIQVNLAKSLAAIAQAASQGAGLISFPEIQFSPFFPQYPGRDAGDYLFPIDHPAVVSLQQACRNHNIVAVPNFYLEESGSHYDASPVIDADGSISGISKMVHVVQAKYYYEQDYYTPSDSGFKVYDTAAGRVGVVICFDRHLPESIRTCTLLGARLIIVPTANIKAEPLDLFEWEMRVQAMHNGVFIAMCNRVGREGEMDFAGESLVIDPFGNVLIKAGDQERLLLAEIDFARVDQARKERPYLALRRPETYRLD